MRPISMASTLVMMVLALGGSAVGQPNAVILLTPAEITWGTRPDGGKIAVIEGNLRDAGPFTMRVIVPAGWSHPPLSHPVTEHLTVLSGTIYIGKGEKFDKGEMKALPAGSLMVMPPNTPHFAMAKEEATIQIHATGPWVSTYVNPADDPRKK
jgi:quercetin dioxygenase-like cupin family protein